MDGAMLYVFGVQANLAHIRQRPYAEPSMNGGGVNDELKIVLEPEH